MNQILATEPSKKRNKASTKTVITFFSICLIIFGICLLSSGAYAFYKSMSSKSTNNINSNEVNNSNNTLENAEIQIELTTEGTKVLAKVRGEKEINYITYKWDDEDETQEEIGGVSGEVSIDIPGGEHLLTVTAVDVKNNTETKTTKVKGVKRPKIEIKQEGSELDIFISDEIGLKEIELKLNGEDPFVVDAGGVKEKQFRTSLESGENTLEVTAHNTEGYTETFNALCRY